MTETQVPVPHLQREAAPWGVVGSFGSAQSEVRVCGRSISLPGKVENLFPIKVELGSNVRRSQGSTLERPEPVQGVKLGLAAFEAQEPDMSQDPSGSRLPPRPACHEAPMQTLLVSFTKPAGNQTRIGQNSAEQIEQEPKGTRDLLPR